MNIENIICKHATNRIQETLNKNKMGNVTGCIARSETLFNQISPGLTTTGYTFNRRPDSYAFRVGMPNTSYGLSISYTPDANEHAAVNVPGFAAPVDDPLPADPGGPASW